MNICRECKHVLVADGLFGNSYMYECMAEAFARKPTTDPQTGAPGFLSVGLNGDAYIESSEYPDCIDKNPLGECPEYVEMIKGDK